MSTITILNGPNLDRLGRREPGIYGTVTLALIEAACAERARRHGFAIRFRQSPHEGDLVAWIHEAADAACVGLVLNAGAYTHTSVAIHDALRQFGAPIMEVHLSNTLAREAFRHHSYISAVASGVILGCGADGYLYAIDRIAALAHHAAETAKQAAQ